MGESKSDFQVFTELAYRLGFGEKYNPRATRDYFKDDTPVDEAYLKAWWEGKVMHHQGVTMPWKEFKKRGVYKSKLETPHVAFRDQVEKGTPFPTQWQDRDLLERDRQNHRFHQDAVRLPHPGDPQVDRAVGEPQQPEDEGTSVPSDQPASASPHPLDLQQHRLAARDLQAGGDDRRVRRRPARHQDRRHGRGVQRARPRHRAGLRHRALHARRRRAA